MVSTIGLALVAYVLGSVPFGFIVGRGRGVDLRQVGSRNIGTTNVYRALGLRIALLVFVLDVLKGLVATRIIPVAWTAGISLANIRVTCGIGVIMGSVASLFMRFRGGKGVATAVGVFLGLAPLATVICLGIWAVLVALFKFVSVGSIAGAIALPVLVATLSRGDVMANPVFYLAVVVAVVIVLRHTANIKRLLNGTEHRIGRLKENA